MERDTHAYIYLNFVTVQPYSYMDYHSPTDWHADHRLVVSKTCLFHILGMISIFLTQNSQVLLMGQKHDTKTPVKT
jgi:hypothetical protein